MEKIRSFRIKKLRLAGFKKFLEPAEFEFGETTSISGHNSQGKTSIAEAITYAITGVPYFGGEKSIDRLYSIGTKEMRVSLTIETDGAPHELTRERIGDHTCVTYDGVPIRQSDLNIMFGERDVFLSIFNPLYFAEELGDDGRKLLERYLPAIPHGDIMARLSAESRALIEASGKISPETLLKRTSGEIRELNETVIYTEGQRDLLAGQEAQRLENMREKEAELGRLKSLLLRLLETRAAGMDFPAIENRLKALYEKRDAFSGGVMPDGEIAGVSQSLERRRADQYVSKFTDELAGYSARLEELGRTYKQEKAAFGALRPGIQCPACKREITDGDIAHVKAAFTRSVNAIAARGKEQTSQLRELQAMDEEARRVFEQFQADDIAGLEARLTQLRSERENAAEDAESVTARIAALERELERGGLTEEELAEYESTLKRHEALSAELKALEAGAPRDAVRKEEDIGELRIRIKEKEALESAARLYISERVNLVFGSLGDLLNRVSVQLYDVVKKTGEVRDVFICTYDGRPYRYLSYSEKIKAGLEISGLLKKLTGSDYPVFIDNGESVPVIDNIRQAGQIIFSQVVKGKPLTVAAVNPPERKAAA